MSLFKKPKEEIIFDKEQIKQEMYEKTPKDWYFFDNMEWFDLDFILIKSITTMREISRGTNIFSLGTKDTEPFVSQIVLAFSILSLEKREQIERSKACPWATLSLESQKKIEKRTSYPWATQWIPVSSTKELLRILHQIENI